MVKIQLQVAECEHSDVGVPALNCAKCNLPLSSTGIFAYEALLALNEDF